MTEKTSTAEDIIRLLALTPHPEGGHFRETFRDVPGDGDRAASTAIYYLLRKGEVSHWHHVDAVEAWHWYGGAALALSMTDGERPVETVTLGMNLAAGERPQAVVPAFYWQSARTLGDWTLVGCTVAPGFEFAGFEMAPPGWSPQPAPPADDEPDSRPPG